MADLPSVPRRLVTTEAPKSSLTRADIESPYASFAKSMTDIGQGLEHIAEKEAEKVGYEPVTIDEEGKPQVNKPLLFTRGSQDAFDRAQRFTALTASDAESDKALLEMRDKFKNDPQGFQTAADTFRQSQLTKWSTAAGPQVGAALDRQMQNRITGITGGLRSEFEHNQTANALISLNTKGAVLANDLETLARRDGIYEKDADGKYVTGEDGGRVYTKQYQEGLDDWLTITNEKTKNPIFKYPKELGDAQFDELRTRLEGGNIHGEMERVYQTQGKDAAQAYLLSASKQLDGKVKQIDKIVSSGMQWLRTEDAGMRGARDAMSREWAEARGKGFETLAPDVVQDMYRRAVEIGDQRTAQSIAVTAAAHEAANSVDPKDIPRLLQQGRPIGGTGRANFMTGPLPGEGSLTTITTPGGLKATVNKEAAPSFEGFLRDLEAAGAPILGVGGHNPRKIAGTNQWSQHAYGNAIDLDQTDRNVTAPALKEWATANSGKLAEIEQKWGMIGGHSFRDPDFGHWEWAGAGGTNAGAGSMEFRAGLMARNILRQRLAASSSDMLAGMTARVQRGDRPSQDEMDELGSMIAVTGDQKQLRKFAETATLAEIGGPQFTQMSAPEQEAYIAKVQERARATGGQFESDVAHHLQQAASAQSRAYDDDPYPAFQKYGGNNPQNQALPNMDMGDVGDMTAIAGARLRQQNTIRQLRGSAPFSVFSKAEKESFKGAIAAADGKQTGDLLGFINALPDEVMLATIGDKPVKEGIKGAALSQDPVKYNAAMTFMDKVFSMGPETAKHVLGEDAMDDLKMWQQSHRYMSLDELAEQRKRESNDPQVKARHKELMKDAQSEARKVSFEDTVGKFNNSWWNTVGIGRAQAPVDQPTGANPLPPGAQDVRDAFMGDYENIYSGYRARGLDKDQAAIAATEKMKTKWTASPTNGGRLMTNAPETIRDANGQPIYPVIDGSYGWMTKQLEADIATQVGKPMHELGVGVSATGLPIGARRQNYSYQLIADRQTQSEAQQGLPASYHVMVTDARTGRATILPKRQNFDPGPARAAKEQPFQRQLEFERARNETPKPFDPLSLQSSRLEDIGARR